MTCSCVYLSLLQVEYKPSSYTKDTLPLLHEFLSIVCSNFVPIPDTLNQITTQINSNFYQLSDTIVQYKRVFDECRRVNPNLAMTWSFITPYVYLFIRIDILNLWIFYTSVRSDIKFSSPRVSFCLFASTPPIPLTRTRILWMRP